MTIKVLVPLFTRGKSAASPTYQNCGKSRKIFKEKNRYIALAIFLPNIPFQFSVCLIIFGREIQMGVNRLLS